MSVGPSGVGGYNIPGSVAGTQANSANADRIKAEQAAQKFQVDQQQFSKGEQDRDQDPTLSADRDPDGRLFAPPAPRRHDDEEAEAEDGKSQQPARGNDPTGERGSTLDIDA